MEKFMTCEICGRQKGPATEPNRCSQDWRAGWHDGQHWRIGYERSQEALAAARRECEGLREALTTIRDECSFMFHRDIPWVHHVAAEALAAPAGGESKPYPDPRCTCHARKSGKHAQSCELWNTTGDM